ncbi:MAG: hypothetical protein E6I80_13715 [Chloroflexi bacterium]|nr:MAG: hypothetical protein E6I80_13715 [Chloroflexota bacterium]
MNEIEEHEQPQDDFEVEIISLDQPSIIGDRNNIPFVPLPPKIRSTRHQPNWSLRLAIVASAVLLAFQVIPNSFSTMQSMMQQAVLPLIPASTPALPPGYDSFYMDKDIPWAKVFVDGHQIRLPRIGVDEPLKLGRGHHLISWLAAPFQPQSCLLSIPFASDDTCRFAFDTVVHKSSLYQVILLHESLNTLPLEQRTALVGTIQVVLGKLFTSEMVQPGEQYARESGPVTARQPLRATLHFQLDTNSNWVCFANMQTHSGLLCGIDRQDCRQLCSAPWQFRQQRTAASIASGWFALAMTRSSWNYATGNGRIVARDQPVGFVGPGLGQQLLLLRIAWDSVWHVNVLLGPDLGPPIYTYTKTRGINGKYQPFITGAVQVADDPACIVARQFVLSGQAPGPQAGESTDAIVRLISASNPAIGCLVVATATDKTDTTPAPILPTARYIVRFGLLLAANPVAYLLRPGVPRADAYELSLVQQLATLPGQAFTDAVGIY